MLTIGCVVIRIFVIWLVFTFVGAVKQRSHSAAKKRSRNGSSKLPSLQIKGYLDCLLVNVLLSIVCLCPVI